MAVRLAIIPIFRVSTPGAECKSDDQWLGKFGSAQAGVSSACPGGQLLALATGRRAIAS